MVRNARGRYETQVSAVRQTDAALGCHFRTRCHPSRSATLSPLPPPLPSGEVFRGLRESGMLAHMRRAGVRCLDVHAVEDNIMAKIADPTFLGE